MAERHEDPHSVYLGNAAMRFADQIEHEYDGDVRLGTVVIVCDVLNENQDIVVGGSDARLWIRQALLEEGATVVRRDREGDECDDE